MAKSLAAELGQAGYVIAPGRARGVDAAVHFAALDTGTIAVQAGGVDVMYTAENTELADNIAAKGLRVSEMSMGLQPVARHFSKRNRIVSGLSQATVIVEATTKSGSLITARDAVDLGRDVLAVSGHPFDARAAGGNMLIRDGATLIRNTADITKALAPIAPNNRPYRFKSQNLPNTIYRKPQNCTCKFCHALGPPQLRKINSFTTLKQHPHR